MTQTEAQAARRRAELLWQQQTQGAAANKAGSAEPQRAQPIEGRVADAKTARLRTLRLAKEAVQREAEISKKSAPRTRSALRTKSAAGADR